MKSRKRKIMFSIVVVIVCVLSFVAGIVVGAAFITNQSFESRRVNFASSASNQTSILTMLREGEIEEAIERLDTRAIYNLWGSSRKTWGPGPRDISEWHDLTLRYWQEAKAYYEKYPEVLQREFPSNTAEVRELIQKTSKLERKGTIYPILSRLRSKEYLILTQPAKVA